MSNLEIVLIVWNLFLQISFFALLALQRSINKTLKETIEILLNGIGAKEQ